SSTEYFLIRSQPSIAFLYFLPAIGSSVWPWSDARPSRAPRVITSVFDLLRSVDDFEPHRARRARDRARRGLEVGGVQVRQLLLRDVADLLPRDLADLVLVRLARALLDLRRSQQEDRSRRGLGDEREGSIRVRGDEDRDDQVAHLRGARVE